MEIEYIDDIGTVAHHSFERMCTTDSIEILVIDRGTECGMPCFDDPIGLDGCHVIGVVGLVGLVRRRGIEFGIYMNWFYTEFV